MVKGMISQLVNPTSPRSTRMFGEMVKWKEWASPMPDDAAQLTTPSLQQLMLANGGIKSARAYHDEAYGLKTLLSTTFTPHMDLNQSWCRRSRPPPRAFGAIFAGNDTEGKCPNWLGLKRGPPLRMRAPLVDMCTSRSPSGSTLRCVADSHYGVILLCEFERVQYGEAVKFDPLLDAVRPALYAACTWDRESLDNVAAENKRPKPWRNSSVGVRLRSFEPLVMRRCNGCELHPRDGRLTYEGYQKLYNSIRVNSTEGEGACDADAKQVENKVVLVRRRDAFNPFHGHETILAVWSTYIALGLDPCDTGLLLTDHFHDKPNRIGGPILELLRRVFAPVYGVEKAIDVSSHPNPTCYKKLYIAIDFIDNFDIPYTKEDRNKGPSTKCGASPWLVAYSKFALTSLGLGQGMRAWRRVPHVTLMARAPYLRESRDKTFATKRVMLNRADLAWRIAVLCEARKSSGTSSIGYNASSSSTSKRRRCTHSLEADMAKLPIRSQISLASATDVLIGTHAAAFTFILYMPPHGVVLEVRTTTDHHYSNLASYLGLTYVGIGRGMPHLQATFKVDVDLAMTVVENAVRRVTPLMAHARHQYPLPPVSPRQVDWPAAEGYTGPTKTLAGRLIGKATSLLRPQERRKPEVGGVHRLKMAAASGARTLPRPSQAKSKGNGVAKAKGSGILAKAMAKRNGHVVGR